MTDESRFHSRKKCYLLYLRYKAFEVNAQDISIDPALDLEKNYKRLFLLHLKAEKCLEGRHKVFELYNDGCSRHKAAIQYVQHQLEKLDALMTEICWRMEDIQSKRIQDVSAVSENVNSELMKSNVAFKRKQKKKRSLMNQKRKKLREESEHDWRILEENETALAEKRQDAIRRIFDTIIMKPNTFMPLVHIICDNDNDILMFVLQSIIATALHHMHDTFQTKFQNDGHMSVHAMSSKDIGHWIMYEDLSDQDLNDTLMRFCAEQIVPKTELEIEMRRHYRDVPGSPTFSSFLSFGERLFNHCFFLKGAFTTRTCIQSVVLLCNVVRDLTDIERINRGSVQFGAQFHKSSVVRKHTIDLVKSMEQLLPELMRIYEPKSTGEICWRYFTVYPGFASTVALIGPFLDGRIPSQPFIISVLK